MSSVGTMTDQMNININRLSSYGKPQEEFLYALINEFKDSASRKEMLLAQDYMKNKNAIIEKKRLYINRDGIPQEDTKLSNTRLCHPFIRKITTQKVDYLLSRPFSIEAENKQLTEDLNEYFTKAFYRQLKNVGKKAVTNGIAWIQVYYDELGRLSFKTIPSEEVKALWADDEHTQLEGVVRFYIIRKYLPGGGVNDIEKVEYHTKEGSWYYEVSAKGLIPDTDRETQTSGHFALQVPITNEDGTTQEDENGNPITAEQQVVWDKIPFICFKYNSDEIPLLNLVKSLIDEYDAVSSSVGDNIKDIPVATKVVKNYDGTDPGEFTHNLAVYKTAFVRENGDVNVLKTELGVAEAETHLTRTRKDIYEAGSAIDTQEVSLGNASGEALKFRYADLDMDADGMATEFSAALEQLIWFILVDILNTTGADYTQEEYDIVFNNDVIVNETESINQARASVGIISDETIIANHPWVIDVEAELAKMTAQKEEQLAEMQSEQEVLNSFGQEGVE